MPAYTRFWDLHLTGGGWYDFASNIQEQIRRQQGGEDGARFTDTLNLITPSAPTKPGILAGVALPATPIPDSCYVASILDLQALSSTPNYVNADLRRLIAWINGPTGVGKLRLNAHCDGMGRFGMGLAPDGAKTIWTGAGLLVKILADNGLAPPPAAPAGAAPAPAAPALAPSLAGPKKAGGLVTITVAACMGARFDVIPATMNAAGRNSTAAPGSAVRTIVELLRIYGLTGIEVTDSNEITTIARTGQSARIHGMGPPLGAGWNYNSRLVDADRAMSKATVTVPRGWTVTIGSRQVLLTSGAKVKWTPLPTNTTSGPSGGWIGLFPNGEELMVPTGWIVDVKDGIIRPPLGWVLMSAGYDTGGTIATPDGDPLVAGAQVLSHSAAKVREVS